MFISKKFKGIYYLYYTDVTGKRVSVSTHSRRKSDALRFLNKFKPGLNNNVSFTETCTISQLQEKVLSVQNSQTPKSFRSYKDVFRHLLHIVGNVPANQVTVKDIEHYKNTRLAVAAKATVNGELARVKAIFQRAMDWNFVNINPSLKIKPVKIDQKEILSFGNDEINKLLDTITNNDLRNIVYFGLLTGCRINEILHVQIKDIDFKERILTIGNKEVFRTKSGNMKGILYFYTPRISFYLIITVKNIMQIILVNLLSDVCVKQASLKNIIFIVFVILYNQFS